MSAVARIETACRHCGLPVPAERRARGDEFCCSGCARVHQLLVGGGLERYYDLRGEEGVPPGELREAGTAWLDPLLAAGPADTSRPRTLRLDVQGVHCAACVWLLRELFLRRAGAVELRINPASGSTDLTWVPARMDVRAYLAEVERFGYRFGPPRVERPPTSRALLVRLGVCAAAAGNVMLFSFAIYAGMGPGDGSLYALFGTLSLALTALIVVVGGWVFFRSALASLRLGVAHLDLPIALGIALAFGGSLYAHLTSGARVAYYDTVAVFVTLMLLGRFMQERVLERNRASLLASEGVEGLTVRRLRGETVESARADAIVAGDDLLVVPGDLVPVAAVALGRGGVVSLDWITGEAGPLAVAAGAAVPAGAFNAGRSGLRVAAVEPFAASRLHGLLGDAHDNAEPSLGPAGAWWHRLGTIYVAAVLALAAIGFAAWLPRGGGEAIRVAVAVLVVTCPCAIGLAIPLARELAHSGLRRAGVFVRREGFLDRALRVRTVLFDKTGTLTHGDLELRPAAAADLADLDGDARSALAAMVAGSNHPVSRALAAALGAGATSRPEDADAMEEVPGNGLEWTRHGTRWALGRPEFTAPGGGAGGGRSETWLSRDGRVLARFALVETLRPDVALELVHLAGAGLAVKVLSGDRPERVRAAAAEIGLAAEDAEGGLDPEAKAERVRHLDRHDTFMVGDGINDAPSFAAAYCTATPAVDRPHLPARADLYYLGDGIAAVRRSLAAARRLRRVVWANLGFAVAYNAVALVLAFAGLVTPLLAAVLMPASSLTVVGHTVVRLAGRGWAWRS